MILINNTWKWHYNTKGHILTKNSCWPNSVKALKKNSTHCCYDWHISGQLCTYIKVINILPITGCNWYFGILLACCPRQLYISKLLGTQTTAFMMLSYEQSQPLTISSLSQWQQGRYEEFVEFHIAYQAEGRELDTLIDIIHQSLNMLFPPLQQEDLIKENAAPQGTPLPATILGTSLIISTIEAAFTVHRIMTGMQTVSTKKRAYTYINRSVYHWGVW